MRGAAPLTSIRSSQIGDCSATAAPGESREQVGARADRVIKRVRAVRGDVLLFSSGHFLRALASRWLGLEAADGQYFLLGTGKWLSLN
jgi:broad specificity phosphatase PhoE